MLNFSTASIVWLVLVVLFALLEASTVSLVSIWFAAGAAAALIYYRHAKRAAHPLLDLLARPHPGQSGRAFMEAVYGHLLVAGNAYVEAVSTDGVPAELHLLRPDRMKVVPGPDGWPEAYDYVLAGRTLRYPVGEDEVAPILHLKRYHPLDDHYGFAPLSAAQVSLEMHEAASRWNKALLDNAARPSGALVYSGPEGAVLSDQQFDRLKRELTDTYQGAVNAGRPLLLEGGLDWKAMSLTPKDMDFLDAKNSAAREIALAFGVPPMLLGIPGDNTYANFQEANRVFWRQTVLPLASRVGSAIAHWLSPQFGESLRIVVDTDRIDGNGPGLGLLPLVTAFAVEKTVRPFKGAFAPMQGAWSALSGVGLSGYEIHHGQTALHPAMVAAGVTAAQVLPDGLGWVNQAGNVLGLYIHGLFEDERVLQALFGQNARSLDAVFDGLAANVQVALGDAALQGLLRV